MSQKQKRCSDCRNLGGGYFDDKNLYVGDDPSGTADNFEYVCRRYPVPVIVRQPTNHWCAEHRKLKINDYNYYKDEVEK